jgi:hypothetical protein
MWGVGRQEQWRIRKLRGGPILPAVVAGLLNMDDNEPGAFGPGSFNQK